MERQLFCAWANNADSVVSIVSWLFCSATYGPHELQFHGSSRQHNHTFDNEFPSRHILSSSLSPWDMACCDLASRLVNLSRKKQNNSTVNAGFVAIVICSGCFGLFDASHNTIRINSKAPEETDSVWTLCTERVVCRKFSETRSFLTIYLYCARNMLKIIFQNCALAYTMYLLNSEKVSLHLQICLY